jgi:glycosyltransferase involved in cell wall biosynthesis
LKVLLLTRHGRLGSSSRQRFYQYLPFLAEQGFEVAAARLHDDSYLKRLYAGGGRDARVIVGDYLRRIAFLLQHRRWDLLWIEKEILPWLPATVDRMLAPRGVPWVVDYDDAVFHRYESLRPRLLRRLLAGKIDAVMRRSTLVLAGNRHLAERAAMAGARRVERLPTVVDLRRYPEPDRPPGGADAFTIGWIGSPTTAGYLAGIAPALRALCGAGTARLVCVGGAFDRLDGVAAVHRPWSESSEAAEIARFDVGIMPLADAAWERGKCGYKLIQYMACGIPVVASPVGANAEIVEHGVQGYLADTEAAWIEALERLRDDPQLRRRMGEAGRRRVEAHYALQDAAPRLAALLREAAG